MVDGIPSGGAVGRVGAVVLTITLCAPSVALAQGGSLDEARAHLQRGNFRAAEQVLSRFLESGTNGEAEYLLGFARIELYRFEEAEESLRRAVADDSQNVDRLHALAKSLLEQGKNLAAIEVLDSALEVAPRADLYFARAMCALNVGRSEAARRNLEASLKLQSDNAEVLYKLGRIEFDEGDYASGKARFEAALKAQPGHLEARALLGVAELRLGNVPRSIGLFRTVLTKVPGHVGALFNLARAYRVAGRQAEAQATLERFRAVSKIQDEADFLVRAVERNPTNIEGRLVLAGKLLEIGKAEEALPQLLAARQLAPRRLEVYEMLAKGLQRLGRLAEARRALELAEQLRADG